jgi:copper homeostasis protein
MPGGDITARNVERILAETGARELHFAAFEEGQSGMRWRHDGVYMGGTLRPPEYDRPATTERAIGAVLKALS